MSRRGRWLVAAAGLLLLPAAVFGVTLAVLDPNDLKPQLAAAIGQATGRTLSLAGPMRIGWSLWPTIEVSDVKLANLPGGTRPDMARAERIQAKLSLLALLQHRLEVIQLTLIGPNILFEEVGSKPNWVFDTGQPDAGSPLALRFSDVHVQNGMVTLKLPERTRVVGIRTLELRQPEAGGPLDLVTVLVYSDNQPFRLTASAQPTGGTADPWNTRLSFAAFDSTASAQGAMALSGAYDLQITGAAPALEKLNALLPEMRLPALHGMQVATHLASGPKLGDLPVIGTTHLTFASADLGSRVPGLTLGETDIALPAAGTPAAVATSGAYRGRGYTLAGTVGIPPHLNGRLSVPLDLAIRTTAAGAQGSLAIKGSLASNAGRFDGLDAGVALKTPALATFRPLVSSRLPALTDLSIDARLLVPASLGAVSLKGAKLSAHEGDLAGDTTIGLGPAVVLDAKLRSARLDIDALLAASDIMASTGGPAGPSPFEAELPWAMLRGPKVTLAATVGEAAFHGQLLHDLDIALELQDGRLQVSRLKLAQPAGPIDASFAADAAIDDAPVRLALHAPGLPLATLMQALELPDPIDGAVQVDAQLRSHGRTLRELAASLDGPFRAAMAGGGSLSNAALLKLTSTALASLGVVVPPQGRTAINCLGLSGAFSNGVGRFPAIALDTTYLKLSGAGEVDLRAQTVALKLNPLAQLSGSPVAVPVLVEGPFHAIQGRLDASGLDKLGILIDSWFGGDHPQICASAGLAPAAVH